MAQWVRRLLCNSLLICFGGPGIKSMSRSTFIFFIFLMSFRGCNSRCKKWFGGGASIARQLHVARASSPAHDCASKNCIPYSHGTKRVNCTLRVRVYKSIFVSFQISISFAIQINKIKSVIFSCTISLWISWRFVLQYWWIGVRQSLLHKGLSTQWIDYNINNKIWASASMV